MALLDRAGEEPEDASTATRDAKLVYAQFLQDLLALDRQVGGGPADPCPGELPQALECIQDSGLAKVASQAYEVLAGWRDGPDHAEGLGMDAARCMARLERWFAGYKHRFLSTRRRRYYLFLPLKAAALLLALAALWVAAGGLSQWGSAVYASLEFRFTDGDSALLASWSFDDANGSVCAKTATGALECRVLTQASFTPGVKNQAVSCSANKRFDMADVDIPPEITISVLAKSEDMNNRYLFGLAREGKKCLSLFFCADPHSVGLNTEDGCANSLGPYPVDGQWHHYVVVVSPENTAMWIDGVKAAGDAAYVDPSSAEATVSVGGSPCTDKYRWKGEIDEAGLYSRALTPGEIKAIHELKTGE